ncbi:MAG: alpha/beta hydrolase [Actinomycetota bacterium]
MVDQLEVHLATGGVDPTDRPATDPIVLLVHGAGMDGTVWQLQTRWLAHHGFRPLAVDLPGHGRSAGEALTSIEDLADWLGRLVDALGQAGPDGPALRSEGEPVAVVGHSMGTFIALDLAARRPEIVSQLVLLGTAAAMPVHPQLLTDSTDDLPAAAALMAAWSHAKPAHVGSHPTPGLWMLGGAQALVEQSAPGALAADFGACAAYQGAADAAAAVLCPVAVGVGRGDKMTPPRAAAELVAVLGDRATVTELADCGHMLMTEQPRAVRRLLAEALSA